MKILLIHPQYPDTFWSFKHAIKYIGKKAAFPPLGMLTVAALLPKEWELKLVDMNVAALEDEDLLWADYVFIGGMTIQKASAQDVISRCIQLDRKIVAGGPLFTAEPDNFPRVHHLVLDEAEVTLPDFLRDLARGCAKRVYRAGGWADVNASPVPRWDLIDLKDYATLSLQYSRGCPFDCEFCEVTVQFGHKQRTKSADSVLNELETLYRLGWRKGVFFVDDNFIGNKRRLKTEIMPPLNEWIRRRKHPFVFSTQSSINLADDEELMQAMVDAGFDMVFVGIETPDQESLVECGKYHNANTDLLESVKKLHAAGLQVQAGFIVGFDNDKNDIFPRISQFINESGIVTAMVGLLNAPPGTKLYKRLVRENRLIQGITGNNTDFSINFLPKMNVQVLVEGYKSIINDIYQPEAYYNRVRKFLHSYYPRSNYNNGLSLTSLRGALVALYRLGLKKGIRIHFWRLLLWTLLRRPRLIAYAMMLSIYGEHFMQHFEIHQTEK